MSENWRAQEDDVDAMLAARQEDPFAVLGPHLTPSGWVIRAIAPDAIGVRALTREGEPIVELERRKGDFFEALAPDLTERPQYSLEVTRVDGVETYQDSYAFGPALGPLDDHLLIEGTHRQLYKRLGAQLTTHEGVDGVLFALWAPNARRVSVVGDFNQWDGRRCQMRKRFDSGMWEIFIPGLGVGAVYKYEIISRAGVLMPLKADPFGFESELRPSTASVVADTKDFEWSDAAYMAKRRQGEPRRKPMTIYECHLGSWRRGEDGGFLTYDELADQLVPYVADLGFTHIELLPISEHPLDEFVGLSAHRPLRADPALWRTGRGLRVSSTRRMRRGSASSSTGRPPTSPPTLTAWRGSTASRSTSTATRARDSIPTGTPQSTISAARRWPTSCWRTPSIGSTASISTGFASTRSPRCFTSTIPAKRRMAAQRRRRQREL